MASRKRTHLSIERKAEVIKYAKDHAGVGVRALAESFGIGKTQVSEILKNKDTILAAYESINSSTSKRPRISKYSEVNERLYEWYTMACSKNIYPGGPQLIAKAKEIAVRLGKADFEGTSCWLSKWKVRYNVKRVAVCGESFNVSCPPVKYYHQKNAWMSGEIMVSYLTTFNQKMRGQKRSVLLLLDNAGCHPPDQLQEKFSNIKIVFLPTNTTSKLQPLDLGIICNFKLHYRRLLLQYVLAKIDTATTATEITKSINVLTAIRWVALALREVKSTTIQKCFRNAGILNTDLDVIALDEADPFQTIDEDLEISSLISRTMGTLHQCTAEEYVNGDNSLSVCVDMDDDQ